MKRMFMCALAMAAALFFWGVSAGAEEIPLARPVEPEEFYQAESPAGTSSPEPPDLFTSPAENSSGVPSASPEEAARELLPKEAESLPIPQQAREYLDQAQTGDGGGLDITQPEKNLDFSPSQIFSYLWGELKRTLSSPLRLLGSLLAVVMLAAVLEGLGNTVSARSLEQLYGTVAVLTCVGLLADPVSECVRYAANTLIDGGNFMISYVPIFSSILAASGGVTSAGSYSVVVLAAAELFTQLAKYVLMPLVGMCMALSVVEAINPSISLSGMTGAVKKICTWGLGLLLTIFVGLLTLQSIVGNTADSLAVRTGKYVVSSFVPVVGGALSEAYSTIRGSLGILRGGVGVFGIIVMVMTVLPSLLSVVAVQAAVWAAGIAAELFGVKGLTGFLKSTSSLLSIVSGLLLCFLMLLIISTAIMMMLGMNLA